MDKDSDLDDTTKFLIDQVNLLDQQTNSEMAELEKQKFTWLFQVVTIASAILGGFMLTKADRNYLEDIALGVLFVCILFALFFVYKYNKYVRKETVRDALYHRLSLQSILRAHELSKKDKLTKEEKAEVKRCEDFQKKINQFLNKKMSEVSGEIKEFLKVKKKESGRYINIAYFMLIGIGLAILVLIYADYIICIK